MVSVNCPSCGEGNPSSNSFCGSCGSPLNKQQPDARKIKKQRPEEKHSEHSGKKLEFTGKNIAILLLSLAIFALIILIASGRFTTHDTVLTNTSANNESQSQPDPHGGVDLSKLEEINALDKLIAANPNDFVSLLNLAHMLNDSGFKQKAIEKYDLYLNANPASTDVWVDRGVCFYEMKDFNNAIESMKKGLEYAPRHQIAHFNIGIVNLAMNNIDEAKKWWQKAVEIDPMAPIAEKAKNLLNNN